jgi:hypothetical protein
MAYLMIAHHLNSSIHTLAAEGFRKTHVRTMLAFESNRPGVQSAPVLVLDRSRLEALAEKSDAHPIKPTEAALRAHKAAGDDLFLKAAGRVQNYRLWKAVVGYPPQQRFRELDWLGLSTARCH